MEKCIILGGGASTKKEIDNGLFDKIKGKATIVSLNYIYEIMPYLPDVQIFSDQHFWNEEECKIEYVDGRRESVGPRKMTALRNKGVKLVYRNIGHRRVIEGAEIWHPTKQWGTPNALYYGTSGLVGTFGLSWACRHFKEIFLLGYDLTFIDGISHSYQNIIKTSSYGVGSENLMSTYQKNLDDWKNFLDFTDVLIYNISMVSKIECFKKLTYSEFYQKLEEN